MVCSGLAGMADLWELLAASDAAYARWKDGHEEDDRLSWRAKWSIGLTCPGQGWDRKDRAQPGDFKRCTATVLNADRGDEDGDLPNWLHYRGACLGCGWVGEPVDDENSAAEDAHDHAWPGWRRLPPVPDPPTPYSSPREYDKRKATWLTKVSAVFPPGWIEGGGPIRTVRKPPGNRHVPQRSPGGGYDMACDGEDPAGQMALF